MNTFLQKSNIFSILFEKKVDFISLATVLVVLILPLGQLTQLPIQPVLNFIDLELSSLRIYLHDLVIISVLFFVLIKRSASFGAVFSWVLRRKLLLVWLLVLGVSGVYASLSVFSLVPLLYLLRIAAYVLFLVLLAQQLSKQFFLLPLVLISLGYYAWLGILQFTFLPDVRFLSALGWDDHYFRMVGTLFDPNFTGSLLLILFWGLVAGRKLLAPWLWKGVLVLIVLLVSVTYSRASYLALLCSGIYYLWHIKLQHVKRWVIAGASLVTMLAISWIIIPKPGGEGVHLLRTSSILARIEHTWKPLLELTPIEWAIGTGLFVNPAANQIWVPDNIGILLVAGTGLVGLMLTLLLGYHWWRVLRNQVALAAVWIAIFVHAQFNNTLLEPFHMLYLGIVTIALWAGKKNT
ncbi:MAG: hypothetical protein WDZ94_03520 [Patescibacteria group bacterium]